MQLGLAGGSTETVQNSIFSSQGVNATDGNGDANGNRRAQISRYGTTLRQSGQPRGATEAGILRDEINAIEAEEEAAEQAAAEQAAAEQAAADEAQQLLEDPGVDAAKTEVQGRRQEQSATLTDKTAEEGDDQAVPGEGKVESVRASGVIVDARSLFRRP